MMAQRYGRNQKRAAKKREAELAKALESAEYSLRLEAHKADRERQGALEEFMAKKGLMRMAVERISTELARALGEELYPHAMKLLASHREPLIRFETYEDVCERKVEVLQGKIPQLNYRVHLLR